MGRPERALNPSAGPIQSFAHDLRMLRVAAGNVPYRELSKRAHYSVAALSQAAAGRDLPSLAVTLAFVRACDGDTDEWERRWRALSAADKRDADPPASEMLIPVQARDSARPRSGGSRLWRTGILTLAAVTICAVAIIGLALRPGSVKGPAAAALASSRPQPGRADPIADGSDPGRAGCGPDAVTLAVSRVHFPASQLSGQIELRYSPHCRAAWGRFEPSGNWDPGSGTMITVWTIRPEDQATQSYSVEFGGETIIGNMLMTARGCVAAEVTIVRGSDKSPVASTSCAVVR